MTIYAFVDEDGVVVNTLEFADNFENFAPFLEAEKAISGKQNLTVVSSQGSMLCSVGNIYNGTEFRHPQPYPSWIWDEAKLVWRAPAMHPDAWPDGITGGDVGDYTWNEEQQAWLPKV